MGEVEPFLLCLGRGKLPVESYAAVGLRLVADGAP
ncbi:predicted protein [Streptomyces viridosporus ATCC 14672]|uniref:Predicted protein n=1 Tax=Streptomyces viridosporus (strain ATCC 14672 / DSM 40746 / JCM 4963 / KCTC 9882 / NRRL B-12104 / FH 1290) TaxID=566461 RepID=D5ZWS1_STRV1|nr:predicted protein [Streptomyces viridosporus ATCC 14672]